MKTEKEIWVYEELNLWVEQSVKHKHKVAMLKLYVLHLTSTLNAGQFIKLVPENSKIC